MKIIALRGKSNTGKSYTLKMLIEMLCDNGGKIDDFGLLSPGARGISEHAMNNLTTSAREATAFYNDVFAVLEYKGILMAISSQGDEEGFLAAAYYKVCKSLRNDKPDIFICAVRTRGGTIDFVNEICDEPPVIFYDKEVYSPVIEGQDLTTEKENEINQETAKALFNLINNL